MSEPKAQQNSTQTVLEAVKDLHELGLVAARETVAHRTGLKLSVVDDRLRALTDEGDVVRVARGVYEPVMRYDEPRAMSRTILPDGRVKYDIGEVVITLTPAEARRMSELGMGAAAAAVAIQSSQGHLTLATQLAEQVNKQRAQIEALQREVKKIQTPGLFEDAEADG